MTKVSRRIMVFLVLCCGVILVGCGKQATTEKKDHKISVVTSTNFYGQIAKSVLGDKGTVKPIIKGSGDPHDFEPSIGDANQVSGADVVVENGIGYDNWMNKLLKNGNDDTTVVDVGKIMHKKDGDNEHLWYDPETAEKLVHELENVYSAHQPHNKKYFHENGAKYLQKYNKVKKQAETAKNNLAQNNLNKKVDVSEPVFDDALNYMGYQVNNPEFANATEKEVDPSPKSIKKIKDDITKHRIAFFVDNTQADSKMVKQLVDLANQHDVPVVKVTETIPADKNYLEWMDNAYSQVLKIQQQEMNK